MSGARHAKGQRCARGLRVGVRLRVRVRERRRHHTGVELEQRVEHVHAAWRARKRLERGEEMLTVRMLETLPGGSEVGAWFSMTAELLMKARTFLWIITV